MSDLSQPQPDLVLVHEMLASVAVPTALHCGGAMLAANDAMCRLTGRTLDELQREPYLG